MATNDFSSLPNIFIDLSKIVNQTLSSQITVGDAEISAISKQLAGLNYQPTYIDNVEFSYAKSFFHNKGASDQAASTLALLVGTVARATDKSIQETLFELSLNELEFDQAAFQILNQNVNSNYSQVSNFQETTSEQSYNRNFSLSNNPTAVSINFTSSPITLVVVGNLYNYIVTTNDGTSGSSLKYISVSKPSWLIFFDVGNGVGQLTGTPTNIDIGTYEIEFIVNNNKGLPAVQKFQLEVNYVNHAPHFVSTQITSVQISRTYRYNIVATDQDIIFGDTITITAPTLPGWLEFTDNHDGTALLVGIAPFVVSTYTVHLLVTDSHALTATQNFTITTVDNSPFFESLPVLNGFIGLPYKYHISATDNDIIFGDTVTLATSSLPGWLTFVDNGDTTGLLSGTPNAASTYNIIISATDHFSQVTTQNFTITTALAPQLKVTYEDDNHLQPTPIVYNSVTSIVDTAVGTSSFITVTIANLGSGNLNISNLILTGDNNFSFHTAPASSYAIIPSSSQTFRIDNAPIQTQTIRTNATVFSFIQNDSFVNSPFRTTLSARTIPMTIQVSGNYASGVVGIPYIDNMAYTILGGFSAYVWTVSAGSIPAGLTINSSTGVMSGTPTTPGTFNFTVSINDNASSHGSLANNIASLTFSIIISAEFLIIGILPNADNNTPYSQGLSTIGGQNPITWGIVSGQLPFGIALRSDTGIISGIPFFLTLNTFNFVIRAVDLNGNITTSTQSITVVLPPTLSGTLPNVEQSQLYSSSLILINGAAPFTWFITAGSLPPGLTINLSTGLISGTAISPGIFSFTVNVQDINSGIGQSIQSVTIYSKVALSGTLIANGVQLQSYSSNLTLSGGVGPYTWSILSGILPDGLTINSSTGRISGTISNIATSQTFQIKVIDSLGVFTTSFQTISIQTIIHIVGLYDNQAENAVAYDSTLSTSGGTTPFNWSVPSGDFPAGLIINSATSEITGSPTTPGEYIFNVLVVDSFSTSDITSQIIIVADALAFSGSLPSGVTNAPYSAGLTISNGVSPFVWSIVTGSLPAGLTINSSTGIISGTPTASGSFSITIQIEDALAVTQTSNQGFDIFSDFESYGILLQAELTASYSNGLSTVNGTGPYTWSITSGSLPSGLSLNTTTGVISGTPTASGNFSITLHVSDSASHTFDNNQILIVNIAPTLIGTLSNGDIHIEYDDQLGVSDGTGPYVFSISVGMLPTGLIIDSATGLISGTPTVLGSFSFTVLVVDFYSVSTTSTQTIIINDILSISGIYTSGTVSSSYSSSVTLSGGTPTFIWSIAHGSLPTGLTINSSTGVISGTPTTLGTFTFIVKVLDNYNAYVFKTFMINISS